MKCFVLVALVASAFALPEGMARFERMDKKDARAIPVEAEVLTGQALVDYVNSKQTLFKAGVNKRFAHMTFEQKKRVIGGVKGPVEHDLSEPLVDHADLDVDIPESFDSREAWPQCPSINHIRDQSDCGSCWAFGSSEAITDRICIKSNGATQVSISADDILSCCGRTCGDGCNGGQPIAAWKWWVSNGVVSGTDYTDHGGCKPYPFPPCEHHNNATNYEPCPADEYPTPKCETKCQDSYGVEYTVDKHYGKSAYGIAKNVEDIQKEIMTNGPVESSFNVFEDFETYTGGIYVHTAGRYLGGHAVKTIGWGVENGTPYWLVANSWNNDWGENGFFRIIRGQNECGFEGGMVAGLAK